jgi:hypothetical protein
MSDIEKILKQFIKEYKHDQDNYTKELKQIKRSISNIEKNTLDISKKIKEFEIILDASEILEDMEKSDDQFDTEWNPYEDGVDNDVYETDDDSD